MAETAEASRAGLKRSRTTDPVDALGYGESVHQGVLQQIADSTGWRLDEIEALYKRILADYIERAQVRDFLFVLVQKRIKRIIGTSRRH